MALGETDAELAAAGEADAELAAPGQASDLRIIPGSQGLRPMPKHSFPHHAHPACAVHCPHVGSFTQSVAGSNGFGAQAMRQSPRRKRAAIVLVMTWSR